MSKDIKELEKINRDLLSLVDENTQNIRENLHERFDKGLNGYRTMDSFLTDLNGYATESTFGKILYINEVKPIIVENSRKWVLKQIYDNIKNIKTKFGDPIHVEVISSTRISVDRNFGSYIQSSCYSLKYQDWSIDDIKDVCELLNIKL